MCEPATLLMVGSVAAGAIKGNAAKGAADRNAAIMESNAALADASAADAYQRGATTEGKVRMRGGQMEAAQKADFAASGVDVHSGSVADVVGSTGAISELDAQIAKNNAAREAFGFKTQASNLRQQAGYLRDEGDMQEIESVLGGVAQGYGYAQKLKVS